MKRTTWILLGILVVGALLRGLYLAEIAHTVGFTMPDVDAAYHDFWARALASGEWIPPPMYADPEIRTIPFFRPPGYPYFLALVYVVSGSSYLVARIVQMLIGLLSVLLAFFLARRWLGERTGLIFAAFMSVYWVFIYFEGELLEPVLLVALSLALVYELALWTEKVTFRRALLTGVIMGVFALVRPNVLLFAPVALLWALWVMRRRVTSRRPPECRQAAGATTRCRQAAGATRADMRRAWGRAVIGLGIGVVLAISPAAIRNYRVARELVPISTNGGINLFIGNNPTANGRVTGLIPGLGMFETCFDYPQLKRNLEAKLGRRMTHTEVSKYFSNEAVAFIEAHPADALRLTGTRALLFWGPQEVGHNKEDELERMNSRVLRGIPGGFPAALALAAVGTAVWLVERRRKKKASAEIEKRHEVIVLALLFVATYFVSYLPFFVAGRYRVPVVPFMLLLGAWGVDRVIALAFERRYAQVGMWAGVLAGAYALACVNFTGYEPNRAFWHFNRGVHFGLAGRTDEAEKEYVEALRIEPDLPHPNTNLGLILVDQGKLDEAIEHFDRALAVLPGSGWAHHGKGIALLGKGDFQGAVRELREAVRLDPTQVMGYYQLGMAYMSRGGYAEAAAQFSKSVELNPRFAPGHIALAILVEGQGRLDEAAGHYEEALKVAPDAPVHFRLGNLRARQGRIEDAAAQFGSAARLAPENAMVHYNLALSLERLKKLDPAISEYKKALAIRPDLAKAHRNLAVLLFFKGDYAGAWKEVDLCRKYGVSPHPKFVEALEGKMPR